MKLKWHAWFKLCAVMFLVLEVGNLRTIFFLLGDFPNLVFWSWHLTCPQLALTQKLLELIRQLWCKLCDTLATISFVFEGGDLLSSHFWTEYAINSVSSGATKKQSVESSTYASEMFKYPNGATFWQCGFQWLSWLGYASCWVLELAKFVRDIHDTTNCEIATTESRGSFHSPKCVKLRGFGRRVWGQIILCNI